MAKGRQSLYISHQRLVILSVANLLAVDEGDYSDKEGVKGTYKAKWKPIEALDGGYFEVTATFVETIPNYLKTLERYCIDRGEDGPDDDCYWLYKSRFQKSNTFPELINLGLLRWRGEKQEKLSKKPGKKRDGLKFNLGPFPSSDPEECLKHHTLCLESGYNDLAPQNPSEAVTEPYNFIPSQDGDFVGAVRGDDLEAIHTHFEADNPKPLVLSGIGGLGKTTLAIEYVNQSMDSYDGCCWLESPKFDGAKERINDRALQIVDFAKGFGIQVDESPRIKKGLNDAWTALKSKGKLLFIFDDVQSPDEIENLIPIGVKNIRVLATSRLNLNKPKFQNMGLELPSFDDAISHLKTYVDSSVIDSQVDDISQVLELVGYLPLALTLLGGYVAAVEESFSDIFHRLKQPGFLADPLMQDIQELTRAKLGVEAVFNLTWQKLNGYCQRLAKVLTIFPYSFIDFQTVNVALEKACLDLGIIDFSEAKVRSAKIILRRHNLIKKLYMEGEKDPYNIHTLISEFFKSQITEEERELWIDFIKDEIIKDTVERVPRLDLNSPTNDVTRYRRRLKLIEEAYSKPELIDDDLAVDFFFSLSSLYRQTGDLEKSKAMCIQCLEYLSSRHGKDHPSVASSLNNLAEFYRFECNFVEAEHMHKEALGMRIRLFGDEHPSVASSFFYLAETHRIQAKFFEAEYLHQEALDMRIRLFGNEHSSVASSLTCLATLCANQNRYSEAEKLYLDALAINKKLWGNEHPHLATNLNNLALLYCNQNRYSEAEKLYLEVIAMFRRLYSDEHVFVAYSLNNLALLYSQEDRFSEAEPLYLESLEIGKRLLGDESPFVAINMHNLADIYADQSKYTEAESFYLKALEILKVRLSDNHPNTVITLKSLAALYRKLGKDKEEQSLIDRLRA
ncbi:MAG: tetratricopeptide repeat protein [Leptolyngbya sp. SIO3F4]|nr:tetratricopeptide repeat protein [Leptolyngbya sp. SIO3F4]